MSDLGDRLKGMRVNGHLGQHELATSINSKPWRISAIERGLMRPSSAREIARWCFVCNAEDQTSEVTELYAKSLPSVMVND